MGYSLKINILLSIYKLMVDYKNIKVPEKMVEEIRTFIENHKELGYRNPSEFIIEAIRKHLIDRKQIMKEK